MKWPKYYDSYFIYDETDTLAKCPDCKREARITLEDSGLYWLADMSLLW